MRLLTTLLACALMTVAALAQEAGPRERLVELMGETCGVGEPPDRLRIALDDLGAEAGPLLLGYLEAGAPAEIAQAARDAATADFDQLQAWIARNPDRASVRRSAGIDLDKGAYVDGVLDRLDLTWRENALRGLAITDVPDRDAAIRAAVEADPRLTILGRAALPGNW